MKKQISRTKLDEVAADMAASGYIGDTSLPQLIWLASVTRYFDKPVSVVVLGPSGSGKSFALSTALRFVSPDAYHVLHGMSEKALVYSQDLDLKHKHLVMQEAAGMQQGQGRVFLRQLLTEGEVNYRTVMSRDGALGAEELRIEGPTGLFMTTTDTSIHNEDASRVLCVHIEEDHEQIRKVLLAQALGNPCKVSEERFKQWHELVDKACSGSRSVNIPFAEALARQLPTTHYRVQRDFPQFLALVRACALLHRDHREVDAMGQVVADLNDYETVRSLVARHIGQSLDRALHKSVREVVQSVERLTKGAWKGDCKPITQGDVSNDLGWDRTVVSRNVRKAIELGLLVDDNPGQGRPSSLVLGATKIPKNEYEVLPSRNALQNGEFVDYEEMKREEEKEDLIDW